MIEYDPQGRMKYNSDLHFNQGQSWNEEDTEYLIDWYDIIGMEEMSLALGRTESTIANKVNNLRKRGQMKKHESKKYTKKILKDEISKPILAF